RLQAERIHLTPLPGPERLRPFQRETVTVGRDGYVRWERAWYGLPWPWKPGQEVQLDSRFISCGRITCWRISGKPRRSIVWTAATALFALVSARYEKGASIILTSNKAFAERGLPLRLTRNVAASIWSWRRHRLRGRRSEEH